MALRFWKRTSVFQENGKKWMPLWGDMSIIPRIFSVNQADFLEPKDSTGTEQSKIC
jgi:hypothetical protein